MDYNLLAELLFPDVDKDISYYEEKYPQRNLKDGAIVTRYAPSPTGFVHIGNLFACMVERKMAKQTDGVFFLRIEDTDQKREVENGTTGIINSLSEFGIDIDEGMIGENTEKGEYGPYKQSERKEIYRTCAKHLTRRGYVYPCFCSEEELDEMRTKQEKAKERPGYYGKWTKCRDLTLDQIKERIANGEKYILRLKSPGNYDKKVLLKDVIKGHIEFPENDLDIVLIKSDGLPLYHFAHVVDDHFMRTTHVTRGDEWISSVPLHIQLFRAMGFEVPKFAHVAPIMKDDNGSKRKLSKRKDPEASLSYYVEQGIIKEAVMEYLMNIANASFEEWRRQKPDTDIEDFKLELNKMNVSGALFDMVKLLDIGKEKISKLSAKEVYERSLEWANKFDKDLTEFMTEDANYTTGIFNIERDTVKPRKDIAKWSDVKENIVYMYDEYFYNNEEFVFQKINDKKEIDTILNTYIEKYYDEKDEKEAWFNKIKDLSEELGYAREVKEYKKDPEKYKGHVGDVSMTIRIALTKRQNTPDLYQIMKLFGIKRVKERINFYVTHSH